MTKLGVEVSKTDIEERLKKRGYSTSRATLPDGRRAVEVGPRLESPEEKPEDAAGVENEAEDLDYQKEIRGPDWAYTPGWGFTPRRSYFVKMGLLQPN